MSVSLDRWIAITLLALISYGSAAVAADVKTSLTAGDAGKIYFNSAEKDATYGQFYKHTAVFDSPIWGDLRFPANMTGDRVPAMVIMHGSAGVNNQPYAWANYFNSLGVATFMLDSFTPRGIQSTATDQSQLTYATSAADGLMALKLLATHPRIDASKIGVIGFSRGGYAAMMDSFEKFRASLVPGDLKYALHIPFYGGCNVYAKTTGAPTLLLVGSKDETFNLEDCKKNVDTLNGKGANIKFVVYEGAVHGFDNGLPRAYAAKAESTMKCLRAIDMDTMEVHLKGAEQAASAEEAQTYFKSCRSFGYSTGTDSVAASKSRIEVKDFITQNFGLAGH